MSVGSSLPEKGAEERGSKQSRGGDLGSRKKAFTSGVDSMGGEEEWDW